MAGVRRKYAEEFREGAVRIVAETGKSVAWLKSAPPGSTPVRPGSAQAPSTTGCRPRSPADKEATLPAP